MNINKEILAEGLLLKAISPLPYERAQRLMGPMSAQVLKLLPLRSLQCRKLTVPRKDGSPMRLCVMRSRKREGKTVGVLWLHGGGYVLGAPEMAVMSFPRQLLMHTDCVVVAPDYTLSCYAPYPAALTDAYTALEWMRNNKEALGITAERFVVGGESAGGGLTAALCLYARDHGDSDIGFQLPLYPMLDDRVTATSADNRAPVWDTRANKAAWHIYLGNRVMNASVEPYAAPARETNYHNLPPAVTIIGTAEPFYAETLTFFDNLKKAGVPTALREYAGAYHAFDMLAPYARISKDANRFLLAQFQDFVKKFI